MRSIASELRCTVPAAVFVSLALLQGLALANDTTWVAFFEHGQWVDSANAWIGAGTYSNLLPGGLLIADTSSSAGSGRLYYVPWQASPRTTSVLEARVKVVSCSGPAGVCLSVADGVHQETLTLYPNRIQLEGANRPYSINTSGSYHTYSLQISDEDIKVYVDGQIAINGVGKFTGAPAHSRIPDQCAFGCGSSAAKGEAMWEWVKYDNGVVPPRTFNFPGLKVSIDSSVLITTGAVYTGLFKYRDGMLAVAGMNSNDSGRIWIPGYSPSMSSFEFPDGQVISLSFNTDFVRAGLFSVPMVISGNAGAHITKTQALLSIDRATSSVSASGILNHGPMVDHSIIQLPDSSLLMSMYGNFTSDTASMRGYPKRMKKYHVWVMRSTDRGMSWKYLSSVAYDPKIGYVGFCEPDLIMLPNREILCFMRTEGESVLQTSPIYQCRSRDNGKTWSEPREAADTGVFPNAAMMENGVLVLACGRPGDWLQFSLDGGESWVGRFEFFSGPTSGYNSIAEIGSDRLLVVYNQLGFDKDGNRNEQLRGLFILVRRT